MTIVIDTPEGIRAYRLLAMRSRLKLEVLSGLGFRQPTTPIVRAELVKAGRPDPGRIKATALAAFEAWLIEEGILRS